MEFSTNYERFHEECTMFRDYDQSTDYCDTEMNISINVPRVTDRSWFSCLWMCLKVNVECTIVCGVVVGLFATLLWWFDLIVGPYCSLDWEKIPERLHRTRLMIDLVIMFVINFWACSSIAPLCGWSVTKELNLVHYSIIGGLLTAVDRLIMYIFGHYSDPWKSYVGSMIFVMTSCTISYRFARHCKTVRNLRCNVIVLTLKLNLQFIIGVVVAMLINHFYLELYYKSSQSEKTILACVLVIALAIPKLFINHIVSSIDGICTTGDEIMLAVAYLTASTIVCRLMQARVYDLNRFIVISFVHGFLNVADKLVLPLKRKLLSCICSNCMEDRNKQNPSVSASLFLANQTLISIITETTCVVFTSGAAYLLRYYYERNESTGERYDGFALFEEMTKMCCIGVAIELIFNVVALQILTYLYNVPVISLWKKKWKSVILVHIIQVLFTVVYFSTYINRLSLMGHYLKESNIYSKYLDSNFGARVITGNNTCIGLFKRE